MKGFGYLRDPLCWGALSLYAVNRLLIRPHAGPYFHSHFPGLASFLNAHFDDLLLLPAALPVVLWLQRAFGWRRHDEPPGWGEMWLHLLVWSVMAKIIGPHYLHIGVMDPWDLLYFTLGGVSAVGWWQYRSRASESSFTNPA
ncbi:MAG TPA: hypothetical protein VF607_07240 [Verrucomicrobiae bacterium]